MASKRAVRTGMQAASAVATKPNVAGSASLFQGLEFHTARAFGSRVGEQYEAHNGDNVSSSWSKLVGVALAGFSVAAVASLDARPALSEAKTAFIPAVVDAEQEAEPKARGRRNLLKKRTKHTAKLEEVDLMKVHLDEYKKSQQEIDSLRARFEAYATRVIGSGDEKQVRAMTFTNFLHSLVLPRFRLQSPRPDLEYTCDFVGDANSLITYEECYLLIHLLQIPKEHFDVAFAMFDLDGDGSVHKAEFCHVIENLLHSITANEADGPMNISAEETLPRLTKYLFGRFGKKSIKSQDLEAVLDLLRTQILKAEFDLYAKPHPTVKNQQVISVHDFAITLVSCFDPERLAPYLERVHALHASDSKLKDIKLAFELIGAEEITEGNGTLDQSELVKVLEMRTDIALKKKHPETFVKRFITCIKEGPQH
ncbi:hypothetical protein FI667_g2784, partial [Globisporangium splendens]